MWEPATIPLLHCESSLFSLFHIPYEVNLLRILQETKLVDSVQAISEDNYYYLLHFYMLKVLVS